MTCSYASVTIPAQVHSEKLEVRAVTEKLSTSRPSLFEESLLITQQVPFRLDVKTFALIHPVFARGEGRVPATPVRRCGNP